MRAFPKDLADVVFEEWHRLVAGDYEAPACPPKVLLRELLEIAHLAASILAEGRYPQFNIVAIPSSGQVVQRSIGRKWPFVEPRPLSVDELRRLAPALDTTKSAIWVEWGTKEWKIMGLADLGASWHRAKMGLEYKYEHPSCLLVQVSRPSRMRVYQGAYHVATLAEGQIEGQRGLEFSLSLHSAVNSGLEAMNEELIRPQIEEPRDFEGFEFIALWNTFAGIANSISLEGRGGSVVIVPARTVLPMKSISVKYAQNCIEPRSTFIEFINARHILSDLIERQENEELGLDEQLLRAELRLRDSYAKLVETTQFVAQLARCDGVVIISEDLHVLGFGGEIHADLQPDLEVCEVTDELRRQSRNLNVEQFGLRHRSAIKLASQEPRYSILVISQDGVISIMWSDAGKVFVSRRNMLVNMNMPWA